METVQHPGSVGAVEAENPPAALPIQPRFYGFWATLVLVAVAVVAASALVGFSWWEAYPVVRQRYWAGIASARPAAYWLWADLACLTVSLGPALTGAVGAVLTGRRPGAGATVRTLVVAAALMVLKASFEEMPALT